MRKVEEYREVVGIDRIRRITGYLTGSVERFNDAKFAEMTDRTKHSGRIGFQEDKVLRNKKRLYNDKILAEISAEK